MTILRPSRAKYQYNCSECSRVIKRREEYFRAEPYPMDVVLGLEKVRHLCRVCILGQVKVEQLEKEKKEWLRNYWLLGGNPDPNIVQQTLNLDEPIEIVQASVELINVTESIIRTLASNPDFIYTISPAA